MNNQQSTKIKGIWVSVKVYSKREQSNDVELHPVRSPLRSRSTSSVALSPSWVFDMPGENENNVEKSDQGDHKKIKETAEK